jgi:hypothetical protein
MGVKRVDVTMKEEHNFECLKDEISVSNLWNS